LFSRPTICVIELNLMVLYFVSSLWCLTMYLISKLIAGESCTNKNYCILITSILVVLQFVFLSLFEICEFLSVFFMLLSRGILLLSGRLKINGNHDIDCD